MTPSKVGSNRSLLVALALCCATTISRADDQAPAFTKKFSGGEGKSVGATFGSNIVVEAGDADSKANLNISDFFDVGSQLLKYRFQASAPFDRKKSDSVDIGSLSGLSAGTSGTFELSLVVWPERSTKHTKAVKDFCIKLVPLLIEGYEYPEVGAWGPLPCGEATQLTTESLAEAVRSIAIERAKCISDPPKDPDKFPETDNPENRARFATCPARVKRPAPVLSANAGSLLEDAPRRIRELVDQGATAVQLWTLGLTGNRQNFKYVLPDAPTTAIKEEQKGWGITGAYTRMHKSTLWSLGYSHEESYEAADKVDICSPLGATGSTSCSEAILGAPEKKTSELAFAEFRYLEESAHVAISPRVQYDIEDSEWAIRLPIYLMHNKEGALTGGVSFGYTSKDDDIAMAIFIGKEFAFFDK